jgi:MEMO1 family protein
MGGEGEADRCGLVVDSVHGDKGWLATCPTLIRRAILIFMSHALPRLRMSLDFMPSPDREQPGLLIRDPYQFSDAMLLIPPQLVPCLACFDGEQTELDLRSNLVQATGEIQVGDLEKHLVETLSAAGFLEDEAFEQIRGKRMREFAEAPRREASHAGSAYPDQPEDARAQLSAYMQAKPVYSEDSLLGIAAPHVSPFGGAESYRDAYAALTPQYRDKTFVVLGTSHYGEPDCFGLTRKPFVTPLGEAITDLDLVDRLAGEAPEAVRMEDYCHAVEHSIEFQVLFLQHVYGSNVRVLPILCGPFARSIYRGGKPEDNDHVRRFFDSLGEMAAREATRLFWILGIDMAHMGRRYGDELLARADVGEMAHVAERDSRRIDRVNAADSDGFWDLVQENHDDLKWCGSSPLYTFLKAAPRASGKLRRYQQWNIDEQSVVSFAALTFHAA